jgi:chromate transporter
LVGVVLNLAVWSTVNTAFARVEEMRRWGIRVLNPDLASVNVAAVAITLLAVLAILRFKVSVLKTLLMCAGPGLLSALVLGFGVIA